MVVFKRAFLLLAITIIVLVSCNIEPYDGSFSEDDIIEQITPCKTAELTVSTALQAFNAVTTEDTAYIETCNTYKSALENQITICGDDSGGLQLLIDALNCDIADEEHTEENGNVLPNSFMTASINKIAYTDMRPNGYLVFSQGVRVNDANSRKDETYMLVQGNSGYANPDVMAEADREINLRIPNKYWQVGTYALYNEANNVNRGVCYYTIFGLDIPGEVSVKALPGEIFVTEFNLQDKVTRGFFKFEYMLINEQDSSEEGPFEVRGTFDYELNDPYFN